MNKKRHPNSKKDGNIFQEIVDVIGIAKTLWLINQWPTEIRDGREQLVIYVCKELGKNHQLAKIIGWDDTKKMVEAFGGKELHPGRGIQNFYNPIRDLNISILMLCAPGSLQAGHCS